MLRLLHLARLAASATVAMWPDWRPCITSTRRARKPSPA